MGMSASADLKWMLVKDNTSFLVKKNGVEFTSEPGNLMNINTYKYSGLANNKTVDLSVNKDGAIEVAIMKKKAADERKPASSYARSLLKRHMVNKNCKAASTLTTLTKGHYYRADLTDAAVARYHALYKSLKADKSADKSQKRKRRGNKA